MGWQMRLLEVARKYVYVEEITRTRPLHSFISRYQDNIKININCMRRLESLGLAVTVWGLRLLQGVLYRLLYIGIVLNVGIY
jgi:hypothetical protein